MSHTINWLPLIGLLPYAWFSYTMSSGPAALVFCMGWLFHSRKNNRILRIADITFNAVGFWRLYQACEESRIYALIAVSAFVSNQFLYTIHHDEILWNLIHVVFVQWYGILSGLAAYQNNPCSSVYFACT